MLRNHRLWHSTWRFCRNNPGSYQPGIPPSVPSGMTVGAAPSGVPPDVSASIDCRAAQAGVLRSVLDGMAVGATASGVSPGVSLPVMALKLHGLGYLPVSLVA
jgi:hypothetical protein